MGREKSGYALIKPIAPINSALWEITSDVNGEVLEMIGREDLTAQVAVIYAALPEEEKQGAAILSIKPRCLACSPSSTRLNLTLVSVKRLAPTTLEHSLSADKIARGRR